MATDNEEFFDRIVKEVDEAIIRNRTERSSPGFSRMTLLDETSVGPSSYIETIKSMITLPDPDFEPKITIFSDSDVTCGEDVLTPMVTGLRRD